MVRRSRRSFLAAVGLSTAALAGCTAGYRPSGSTPGVVDAQSALEPTSTPATPLADAPLSPVWEADDIPGQFTLSTPGVDADRLYVGSRTEMTAIAREGGGVDWRVDLGALTHGYTPAVDDGTVLAPARDIVGRNRVVDRGGEPTLTALEAATGDRLWGRDRPVSASPAVADGRAFVPFVDDEGAAVAAYDLATGEERWTRRLSTPEVFAAPAVGDGVYVATVADGDDAGVLVALSRDGERRWSLPLEGGVYKGPSVAPAPDGETVYVGTTAGSVYAVDAGGEARWRAALEGPVNTTPAVGDGRVYATTPDCVVALEADSGAGVWSGRVDNVAKTGIGLGGGMVHVGGNEVAAFDAGDGAARWRIELPGVAGTFGSPIWLDDRLYTGACVKADGSSRYDHVVYALA